MRHGESEFNNANIFTGWCDVALTKRGIVEAEESGEVFSSNDVFFDKCYTSVLSRATGTAWRALECANQAYVPMCADWRLNERHYGALQGLNKEETLHRLGKELVMPQSDFPFFLRVKELRCWHLEGERQNKRAVMAEWIRTSNSSSGVSVQRSVGSNPSLVTCVLEQDT